MSAAVAVGARFAGTLMWTSFGPLKRLPSQTFTNRSSELDVPAVKVVCASWASDTAKVLPRRLHRAAEREVAARWVRVVVEEEVQQVVAVGVARREQRRRVEDISPRGRGVGRRHRRSAVHW